MCCIYVLNKPFTCVPFAFTQGYPIEYANPAKRFHYEHSQAEIEHLGRASGLEKVKLTICAEKDLLPDEDARIFTKVSVLLLMCDNLYRCVNWCWYFILKELL